MIITWQDWRTARKYGCKLSWNAFELLYAEQEENVKRVVEAWCEYFMRGKK